MGSTSRSSAVLISSTVPSIATRTASGHLPPPRLHYHPPTPRPWPTPRGQPRTASCTRLAFRCRHHSSTSPFAPLSTLQQSDNAPKETTPPTWLLPRRAKTYRAPKVRTLPHLLHTSSQTPPAASRAQADSQHICKETMAQMDGVQVGHRPVPRRVNKHHQAGKQTTQHDTTILVLTNQLTTECFPLDTFSKPRQALLGVRLPGTTVMRAL